MRGLSAVILALVAVLVLCIGVLIYLIVRRPHGGNGAIPGKFTETPFTHVPGRALTSPTDVPNYDDIQGGSGGLWDCGDDNYDEGTAMCYRAKGQPHNPKDPGGADNVYSLCSPQPNPWYSQCCQSPEGCRPKGLFNWIIGTCNGPVGAAKGTCETNPNPSQMIVNYVGSYQYDPARHRFVCQQESSFNMDGRHPPYDTSKLYGGLGRGNNWLPGPLPGGAANWRQGYYPAGRPGVGAPAMLIIISVNKISNACWYVLNQSDLDRGPVGTMSAAQCKAKMTGNTWGCNNSGEFDFLEPYCNGPRQPPEAYLKGYSTGMSGPNLGQYGRCLFWSSGVHGGHTGGGGWAPSSKYFTLDGGSEPGTPRIFVGVVDQMGMRTYQVPGDGKNHWDGIALKTAAMELPVGPSQKPSPSPCASKTSLCATFNPFCPVEAGGPENYDKYKCLPDGNNRGFCGNFAHDKLTFLGPQSLWGTPGLAPVVDGQKIGSWNADMESAPEG